MKEPDMLNPAPPYLVAILGGVLATVLLSAILFLAPAFGYPFIALPHLIGGIFTGHTETAFWLGYALFFLTGAVLIPLLVSVMWSYLPGHHVSMTGALLKGVIYGALLFLLMGLLLPFLELVSHLSPSPLERTGLFAANHGIGGVAVLLAGQLAYALAVAIISAMGQGISPIQAIGWRGYQMAAERESALIFRGTSAIGERRESTMQ